MKISFPVPRRETNGLAGIRTSIVARRRCSAVSPQSPAKTSHGICAVSLPAINASNGIGGRPPLSLSSCAKIPGTASIARKNKIEIARTTAQLGLVDASPIVLLQLGSAEPIFPSTRESLYDRHPIPARFARRRPAFRSFLFEWRSTGSAPFLWISIRILDQLY